MAWLVASSDYRQGVNMATDRQIPQGKTVVNGIPIDALDVGPAVNYRRLDAAQAQHKALVGLANGLRAVLVDLAEGRGVYLTTDGQTGAAPVKLDPEVVRPLLTSMLEKVSGQARTAAVGLVAASGVL